MVRFIKAVNTIDKILDCVPVVSTVKNAGILLYQLAHKVNKVANPVNTSWKDDIKIHVLSKDDFIAGISMIPIVGNLTVLVHHIINWMQMGYLGEATRAFSFGLKNHSYEVVALYLARNPDRSEEKICKALRFAASVGKEDIVKLILDSRNTWSSDSIEKVLKFAKDAKIAKIILDQYADRLTDKQAGSVLSLLAGWNKYSVIKLLIATYPNIDINEVGQGLERAARRKDALDIVHLLLNRFPQIEEKYVAKALEEASKNSLKEVIEALLQHSPNLVSTHLDALLERAADRGDTVILNWLLDTYKDNVSSASIGKILKSAVQYKYFGEDDKHLLIINSMIEQYPDLSGKDLEPAMDRAASLNNELFERYLKTFTQLQPENLQTILNNAVFVQGSSVREGGPNHFSLKWDKAAQLIMEKFPEMVAVDPHSKFREKI
jgi:hypothetical protein